MTDMRRIALVNRYFHGWLIDKLKREHAEDMEMINVGKPFIDMSLEHRVEELMDFNGPCIIADPGREGLDNAIAEGNEASIMNVIHFRNDYVRLFPDEIGHIRAALDEHIPSSYRHHLIG